MQAVKAVDSKYVEEDTPENSVFTKGEVLLQRYEIIGYLGAGGMGAVYKALDRETGLEIALKTLSADPKKNEKAIRRFRNEFSVMQELRHPNIVEAYQLHEAPSGRLFITLELVTGTNLDQLIHESDTDISFEKKLDLLLQIARGLAFAHEKELIHRDLKPANVLVSSESCAKIVDFGLARHLGCDMKLTQSSERIGTAYYMSPEQHRGEELDPRSDIYSFGVLAYELFARRRPFDGETQFQVFIAHVSQNIPSLTEEITDIPKWVETLVEICTEKEAKHRYPDMGQVVGLLENKIRKNGKRRSIWNMWVKR